MSKCIDCTRFPWKPGADMSMSPAMRCHPDIPMKRWSNESAAAENNCPLFNAIKRKTDDEAEAKAKAEAEEKAKLEAEEKAKAEAEEKARLEAEAKAKAESGDQNPPPAGENTEGSKEVVNKDATNSGTKDKASKTAKRGNTGGKK